MFAVAPVLTPGIGCRVPTADSSGRSETSLAVLVAVLALSACTNAGVLGPEPAVSTDAISGQSVPSEITLRVGESARPTTATVTFVGVSDDSRCPTGVSCVWEGDAVVTLRVTRDAADETVALHANPRFAQEATVAGLRLRLVRLEPYPEADRPIAADDYRVVLTITSA